MAFTTVTGSNGVTSLVGTTGVDVATIVTLASNVFVGGNTGDDNLTLNLAAGNFVASNYDVRMGGGDDIIRQFDPVLDSFISLDGETLANDGNDTFNGFGSLIINSEIVGRGGNDVFTNLALNGSTVNGNTGNDTIALIDSSASFVYGGAATDTITIDGNSSSLLVNGNKGSDNITVGAFTLSGSSLFGGNGNDQITAANAVVASDTSAGIFLSGDLGDDNVTGSGGVDTIFGGDGIDALVGNAGADIMDGGAGNDAITGSAQGDVLTGGTGFDRFILTALADSRLTSTTSNTGFDDITDFAANTGATGSINGDRIQFGATLDFDGYVNAIGTVGLVPNTLASGGLSLAQDLTTFITAPLLAVAGDVVAITIGGAVSWAGNYIVIGGATGGYQFGEDAVIKLNTVAGLTDNAFLV